MWDGDWLRDVRWGIWYNTRLNMSGEMHMRRRRDAKARYSAAYPTGRERIEKAGGEGQEVEVEMFW